MARNLIDKIDEYAVRNMKEYQEGKKQLQQQQDEAATAAATMNEADLDQPDSPPPHAAAELEEEECLISASKIESSKPTEGLFSSEVIIDNPDTNVNYHPLDLLCSENASGQLVDVTHIVKKVRFA